MMIFVNECFKVETIYRPYAENVIKMLSCIAPHICEEMWQILGHENTLTYEPWPTYDEKMLVLEEVEMVVQVNGKVRAKMQVATGLDNEEIQKLALAQPNVQAHTEGKTIAKVIIIKNKIVNIVAK